MACFILKTKWELLTANPVRDTAIPQVTTTISLKLALREEDCLKTPAECMIIDAAFSMENGRLSKAEERRQVRCSSACIAHISLHFSLAALASPQICAGHTNAGDDIFVGQDAFACVPELERCVFALQPVGSRACRRHGNYRHTHQHAFGSFKVFVTISSGPNAKAEQEEMEEVIPWWRQNFIEEFGALAADVVVENTDEANFLGGTEEDRKLTKERIQVIPDPCALQYTLVFLLHLSALVNVFAAERVPQDAVAAQVKQPFAAAAFVKVTFIFAG
jgi:hypothetical protein